MKEQRSWKECQHVADLVSDQVYILGSKSSLKHKGNLTVENQCLQLTAFTQHKDDKEVHQLTQARSVTELMTEHNLSQHSKELC